MSLSEELQRQGSRPLTVEEAFRAWDYVDRHDVERALDLQASEFGQAALLALELQFRAGAAVSAPAAETPAPAAAPAADTTGDAGATKKHKKKR